MKKTFLEQVLEEATRPIIGAVLLLCQDFEETMNIPDAPWKILNKPYKDLTEQELLALMDIYHTEGEVTPCPFCNWVAREELMLNRQNIKEFGG